MNQQWGLSRAKLNDANSHYITKIEAKSASELAELLLVHLQAESPPISLMSQMNSNTPVCCNG